MAATADETRQRLKAELHHTVGLMCQEIAATHKRDFSRQVIVALTETTFRQCELFAIDLEAFARHAKRSTVSTEDVKLLGRRSSALYNHIKKVSDGVTQEQKELRKKSTGKKKSNKDLEEESRD